MIEVTLVLVIVGITGAMSAGRIHQLMIQQLVARAATVLQNDLESAFAIAIRNRRPIRISWNSSSMQLGVTDRAGSTTYRHSNLGSSAFGLRASNVSVSTTPVEIYPNGLANNDLTITLTMETVTKRIWMSRAGLVIVQ